MINKTFCLTIGVCITLAIASTTNSIENELPGKPLAFGVIKKPEEIGMSRNQLKELTGFIKKNGGGSGLIIRNGFLVWQWGDVDKMYSVASCTKSFTSTVVGLAIDDGKCGLDDYAKNYLPELKKGKNAKIKIIHLLSMTSGYGRGTEPEAEWRYNESAVHILGKLATVVHKDSMKNILEKRIMVPIGAKHWRWRKTGQLANDIPINSGGSGIEISAIDFARLGSLFLHNGNWNGKQLISQKWVEEATKTSQSLNPKYGMLWWVNTSGWWKGVPRDSYCALGANAQSILWICPSLQIVAVRLGGNPLGNKDKLPIFLKKIVDAVIQTK